MIPRGQAQAAQVGPTDRFPRTTEGSMRLLPLLRIVAIPVAVLAACQSDATSSLGPPDDAAPLAVIPNVVSVNGGNAVFLTAKLRDKDGSYSTPAGVKWSTSDGRIASVDATGRVEGLQRGRAQIVATWQRSRGSSVVTVIDAIAKKQPPSCEALLKAQQGVPPTSGCS
jgi:hypothetical protein